jgi:hypothetical protein
MTRAYPLEWPVGWPRTAETARRYGAFKSMSEGSRMARPVTIFAAMRRVTDELDRLGAKGVVVSSNLDRNRDGSPKSEQRRIADPGIAVYFAVKGQPRVLACDRYTEAAQNMAAIAAHIDALRTMLRHGVGTADQAFAGYAALPPPPGDGTPAAPQPRPWREVLGEWASLIDAANDETIRAALIDTAFKNLSKKAHPDAGGSDAAMAELNAARDQAKKEFGA